MRIVIAFVVLMSTIQTFGQVDNEPPGIRVEFDCWVSIDGMINQYADSLNFFKKNELPKFLLNKNLDYELRRFTRFCFAKDKIISFRKAIFDRVVNDKVLFSIVHNESSRLDSLYSPAELERTAKQNIHISGFPNIPYMEYSTRELARLRLDEIRRGKIRHPGMN